MTFQQSNFRAAKMTPSRVLDMRLKYQAGWTQGRLAREFHLSIGQVGRIVRGESWQQFQQPETADRPITPDIMARAKESEARIAAQFGISLPTAEGPEAPTSPAEPGVTPARQAAIMDRLLSDLSSAKKVSVELDELLKGGEDK